VPAVLARSLLAAAAVAAMALGLSAGTAGAADTLVAFQTPSKAIGCQYSRFAGEKPALRCDVADVVKRAAKPASCELDYGSAFGLAASGKARRLCVGDTAQDPKAKVLAYGRSRTLGPFTCTSRKSGLRCATHAGHGFELSRARQRLF
jgi:hypothetical protein